MFCIGVHRFYIGFDRFYIGSAMFYNKVFRGLRLRLLSFPYDIRPGFSFTVTSTPRRFLCRNVKTKVFPLP